MPRGEMHQQGRPEIAGTPLLVCKTRIKCGENKALNGVLNAPINPL
jgi:hypothetical protein